MVIKLCEIVVKKKYDHIEKKMVVHTVQLWPQFFCVFFGAAFDWLWYMVHGLAFMNYTPLKLGGPPRNILHCRD